MDLMTRAEFETLTTATEGLHVSLFLPTHRVSGPKETEADRLRWKNLLTAVSARLREDGTSRAEVDELLAPAWQLHDDAMAWSHMADGLAAFLRNGEATTFRVPLELPELAAVGQGFLIGPMLPLLTDETFLVLTVSQKHVRVLRGTRSTVGELDLPDVPSSFDDVFDADGPADYAPRPNASGRKGGAGGVYYGSGTLDNVHKDEVTEFLREVAEGVHSHLAGRTLPMVLAGLPEWVAVYRDVNRYPHVLEQAIEKNPDTLSAEDLRAAAWELVRERLDREGEQLVDRLQQARGHGGGAMGPEQVLPAAVEGRVDTLLLTRDGCWAGSNGSNGTEVVVLGGIATDPCELLDGAAMATLRNGGAVRVLEELPDGQVAAALLRY